MKHNVATQSPAVAAMATHWQLIDDLKGGTSAMRAAGTRYLPKRLLEEQPDYDARLAVATLYPAFAETVKSLVGRTFAEPLSVNDDVPEWIRTEVVPDIDRQGRALKVFARQWFRDGLEYGLTHALVESPVAEGVLTLEDQRKAGIRPYVIQINPKRILGWRADAAGKLTQLRVAFQREEDDGEFGTRLVDQVKVYEPGLVRTFEKDSDGNWVEADPVNLQFDGIPLVTFYANRTGLMTATPPLLELAQLNAKHWAKQSSNDALVETASVPILALSGVSESDTIVIGAKHAIKLPKDGRAEFVEHSGAAIGAGRDALEDLKREMRDAGARLLDPNIGGARTATEAGEDAARTNSDLASMVQDFQDSLAQLLDVVAKWRSEPAGGSVTLHPNLKPGPLVAENMKNLNDLNARGVISDETLFNEAKRLGQISDDVEWEDEQKRLELQGSPPIDDRVPAE